MKKCLAGRILISNMRTAAKTEGVVWRDGKSAGMIKFSVCGLRYRSWDGLATNNFVEAMQVGSLMVSTS